MQIPKWITDNFNNKMSKGNIFIRFKKHASHRYNYCSFPTLERFVVWLEDRSDIERLEFYKI